MRLLTQLAVHLEPTGQKFVHDLASASLISPALAPVFLARWSRMAWLRLTADLGLRGALLADLVRARGAPASPVSRLGLVQGGSDLSTPPPYAGQARSPNVRAPITPSSWNILNWVHAAIRSA
jgi:hypothetical protein